MTLKTEWVRYGQNRDHLAFIAYPGRAAQPMPAVVVIQEIWGLDAHIEDVTRRIADAGYVALAPDLLAKGGERPPAFTRERVAELQGFLNRAPQVFSDQAAREAELAKLPAAEAKRIDESFKALIEPQFNGVLNVDDYVPQLTQASDFLRNSYAPSRGQKVGSVGFCQGGGLALRLAAADAKLAGAICFYGIAPGEDQLKRIQCPVLGLYGGTDPHINGGIPALAEAMKKHGKRFEMHMYDGAEHAFFNDGRPAYHVSAARDAFVRMLSFFQKNLV